MLMYSVLWAWYLTSGLCSAQTEAPTANNSTACYGTPGNGCTDHTLSCEPSLVISITSIRFGYRRGCAGNGISNCGDIKCCSDLPGDCFTPLNQTLLLELQDICDGESMCILDSDHGLNETSADCGIGNIRHSFQKIEYLCVADNSSYTIQSTTETTVPSTVFTNAASRATSTNTQDLSSSSQPTSGATSPSSVSTNTVNTDQAPPTNTTSPSSVSTDTSSQALPSTIATDTSSQASPSTIVTDTSSQASPSTIATDTSSQAPRTNTQAVSASSQQTGETKSTSTVTNILPPNQAAHTNTQDKDVGTIVGGILGAIVVIAIVAAFIFFIKRRQSEQAPAKDVYVNKNGSNPHQITSPINDYKNKPNIQTTPIPNSDVENNYVNIEMSGVTSDDEYDHLKGNNSNKPSVPDSNYDHVGSFNPRDQNTGDNKPHSVTDDTYDHIGEQNSTGADSGDHNHIEGRNTDVNTEEYNHIGGNNTTVLDIDEDEYIVTRL
ncbi:hypothetical protein SNE40_020555 [Patella caerulea]|uniref:Uncharacterized protein n=1 Tax=Patella caerulea TaxID=87958 RepID=A0AAN8IYP9_PATCE